MYKWYRQMATWERCTWFTCCTTIQRDVINQWTSWLEIFLQYYYAADGKDIKKSIRIFHLKFNQCVKDEWPLIISQQFIYLVIKLSVFASKQNKIKSRRNIRKKFWTRKSFKFDKQMISLYVVIQCDEK